MAKGMTFAMLQNSWYSRLPQGMTAWQNARIKSSVRAAFYPCCALGQALGSEG
jgi:hypothetical protein